MRSSAYDYVLRTPSPKSKRKSWSSQISPTFSDRLIPSRAGTDLEFGFDLLEVNENAKPPNTGSPYAGASGAQSSPAGSPSVENGTADRYHQVLQSELLGKASPLKNKGDTLASPENNKLFQYKSLLEEVPLWSTPSRSPVPLRVDLNPSEPIVLHRHIPKTPVKVLDAPDLKDDFYFNLLDWSASDDLAVGLGSEVYAWNASNTRVTKLCDLECSSVTSVNWDCTYGRHLAVGSSSGDVQIWDKEHCKKLRSMTGHRGNVYSVAWNGWVLSTGGADGCIFHRDVRQPEHYFAKVQAHRLQVCGLKWSTDGQKLASGSDDCKVRIWSLRSHESPVLECSSHLAAVKALAWSPYQPGVLATGGGVADKSIHIWNTVNDVTVKSVDTGSQVCNLVWSKNVNEIVSTHGYSQNEIAVWKYPALTRAATLTGHSSRVLYLAISPDGRKIATGSGDFSVRVWDVFPAAKACAKSSTISLLPSTIR